MHKLVVKLRPRLLVFLTHNMALPLLRLICAPQKFPYSKEALDQLPESTLGKQLATMLDNRNLKLLPYFAKHDIKHILLQYDTTDDGEVCLQCFMLGNRYFSFPVIDTILFGTITMPEYWSKSRKAFNRGARCPPIENWQWFTLLHQSNQSLIKK